MIEVRRKIETEDRLTSSLKNDWTIKTINEVEKLSSTTPDGVIVDPDTILADIMDAANFEESGIASELFDICKTSKDKKSVKEVFELLTGVSFDSYLTRCCLETTRKGA